MTVPMVCLDTSSVISRNPQRLHVYIHVHVYGLADFSYFGNSLWEAVILKSEFK